MKAIVKREESVYVENGSIECSVLGQRRGGGESRVKDRGTVCRGGRIG